jgi:hypothetical protein
MIGDASKLLGVTSWEGEAGERGVEELLSASARFMAINHTRATARDAVGKFGLAAFGIRGVTTASVRMSGGDGSTRSAGVVQLDEPPPHDEQQESEDDDEGGEGGEGGGEGGKGGEGGGKGGEGGGEGGEGREGKATERHMDTMICGALVITACAARSRTDFYLGNEPVLACEYRGVSVCLMNGPNAGSKGRNPGAMTHAGWNENMGENRLMVRVPVPSDQAEHLAIPSTGADWERLVDAFKTLTNELNALAGGGVLANNGRTGEGGVGQRCQVTSIVVWGTKVNAYEY